MIMMRWLAALVLIVMVVVLGVFVGTLVWSTVVEDQIGVVVPLDSPVR